MRCDVQIHNDGEKRILNIRLARKTRQITLANDLIEELKVPSKTSYFRKQIEDLVRPHIINNLGLTETEMKAILDEFLAS